MTLILEPPVNRTKKQPLPAHVQEQKSRLDVALKPDTSLRRVRRDWRVLVQLVPIAVLPFASAIALALLPARWGITGDWRTWIDPVAFCTIAGLIAVLFALGVRRVMRTWEASAPDSPEAALREFYRVALMRRPPARRLAGLVRGFNLPGPALRPVLTWMTAAGGRRIDSPKSLVRYWRALIRGNVAVRRNVRLQSIELDFPRPDVALARVALRTSVTRRARALIAALAGMLIAAAPIVVGPSRIYEQGIPFWGVVASALGLGFGVAWLIRKLNRAVVDRLEMQVNKLLVHASWNWRLLSGEWESADEVDSRWLLTTKRTTKPTGF
jgi:hypothetical protein